MPDEQATVETEVVSVGEHEVGLELTPETNELTVKLPEGLSPEERAKISASIEKGEVGKLSAAYYRKLNELNTKQKQWEEAVEAERQPKTVTPPDPASTTLEPIWKRLGLNSKEELTDFIADNPDGLTRYHEEVLKEAEALHQTSLQKALAEQEGKTRMLMLEQDLGRQGIDVAEARAFAKAYGMEFGDKSIELYVELHRKKSNPVFEAQTNARKNQINFVESTYFRLPSGNLTAEELDKLPPEQQDAILEAQKKALFNS